MTDLRALTFWRPWPDAILRGGKNCENRPAPPPKNLLGKTIALHAGKRYELGDWEYPILWMPPSKEDSPEGIVGTAKILGAIWVRDGFPNTYFVPPGTYEDELNSLIERLRGLPGHNQRLGSPWFSGPVGILLDDVIAIDPVPCKGAMGYWRVPPTIAAEVLSRAARAA